MWQPELFNYLNRRTLRIFYFIIILFCIRLTWLHLHAPEGTGVAIQLIPMMAPGKMVNCVHNKMNGTWPVSQCITCEYHVIEKRVGPH